MSDYVFYSKPDSCSLLSASIKEIYTANEPTCDEFTGEWGSLSVSKSPYGGLQPVETETHVCAVLGGPVYYFRDNSFLTGSDPYEGTLSLLTRYLSGTLDLANDISGPFQFLIIDKQTRTVTCVTDLMLFIPAYISCSKSNEVVFGSHIDAVARIQKDELEYDRVSIADFILNGIVTYPFTVFKNIKQMQPATKHCYTVENKKVIFQQVCDPYWLPYEKNYFDSLNDAAGTLREGVKSYIYTVTESMDRVAQFISGGEDSRVLLGLMPKHLQKDGYVFLDKFNREGRIAKKVAEAYGANLTVGLRTPLHYLDIAAEGNALVGSGHQYLHCHSLKFDKQFAFSEYNGVFGGYLSDSLLKGAYARKSTISRRLKFLPERWVRGETQSQPVKSPLFNQDVLDELTARRIAHVSRVKEIRPETAHEWFVLWPSTMRKAITNHYCNRRLFRSYEVFMSHEVVKVSASVPTNWKLNRKLFHRAFQPCLKSSMWIRHGDGRLPYFGWSFNKALEVTTKIVRKLNSHKELSEGPWAEFTEVIRSAAFRPIEDKIEVIVKSLVSNNFKISLVTNPRNILSLTFLVSQDNAIVPQKDIDSSIPNKA